MTLSKHWEEYIRPRSCRRCGHKKFYVDKWMLSRGKRQKCDCGGYPFVHRRRSKYCHHHPRADLNHALRQKADPTVIEELRVEAALQSIASPSDECPF